MADALFDLYFAGKILAGENVDVVRQRVGKIFRADERTLQLLFSGTPVRIKSGVDQEAAIRYRVVLRDAGALLEIKPHRQADITTTPAKAAAAGENLTLLPPNTGSLIDCAVPVAPYPLPDFSNITLDPPGVIIDESVPPASLRIKTTAFTLAPPNTGSLQEWQARKAAEPLPDISHMQLATEDPVEAAITDSDN